MFPNHTDDFTPDLSSPWASEMLEPMNHRTQWREGERGKKQRGIRGDGNEETTWRVDPMGVKLKIKKFSYWLHSLFLNNPPEICSVRSFFLNCLWVLAGTILGGSVFINHYTSIFLVLAGREVQHVLEAVIG